MDIGYPCIYLFSFICFNSNLEFSEHSVWTCFYYFKLFDTIIKWNCSFLLIFRLLIASVYKQTWSLYTDFASCNLVEIIFYSFLGVNSLKLSIFKITSSANKDSFTYPFLKKEYRSGLPFPLPGDLPDSVKTHISYTGRWILYRELQGKPE